MSHIRYSVLLFEDHWIVRRDTRRLGAFRAIEEASRTAQEGAAIDRVRGNSVEILVLEEDGRWTPFGPDLRHTSPIT